MRLAQQPPCRFDVVSVEAGAVEWLRGGFRRVVTSTLKASAAMHP